MFKWRASREHYLCRSLRDEAGAVAVYVAIMAFVLVGVGGFAIDLTRYYTLQSELKKVADGLAIAAARELGGQNDAIVRATKAITLAQIDLVRNTQTFATGAVTVNPLAPVFFAALPPYTMSLTDPGIAAYVTADPTAARFVAVTVETRTINNYLIPILSGPTTSSINASALAGQNPTICNVPGLMMCNPDEAALGPGAPFTPIVGQQILAKAEGGGAQWGPGDFGLIDPPLGGGNANAIREMLAAVNPNMGKCISANVDIQPGQETDIRVGFNVRFDKYDPPMNKSTIKNNPNFIPAKNVTKGWVTQGSPCNYELPPNTTPPTAMAMPRDNNISAANRFGNGIWDFQTYWSVNHPSVPSPWGANPSPPPPRHAVYRWEVENNQIPNNSPTGEQANTETSSCYGGSKPCLDPYDCPGNANFTDRRVLYVAVINCEAAGIAGNASDVPVLAFAKVFLTEPIGDDSVSGTAHGGNNKAIYIEMIGAVQAGVDSVFHDEIVLYR